MEKTMTGQIKPTLSRRIGIAVLLTLLTGLNTVFAADSGTNPGGGTDNALVSAIAVHRDPFWPVGYTPERAVSKGAEKQNKALESTGSIDWKKAMKQVEIQGVSSRAGNEFFAIINGQVKSAGETVSVQVDSVGYTWMIEGISPPSSVKLRRVSAQ